MSLVTGKVRFSYANVFEPRKNPNGDEKYSLTILIPKSDTNTYQNIMNEMNKVLQENVASVFNGVMPANPKMPIYDGDGLRPSGEAFNAECKGHWVMTANSNTSPEVVDANCQPIISKNEFYSGCYGRASLRFYAYNQNGNKGIGCGLGNVQKLEDGQPLDGRTTAAEDFGTPIPQTAGQTQMQTAVTQSMMPQAPIQQQSIQANTFMAGQFDPITGQMIQPTIGSIYGVN